MSKQLVIEGSLQRARFKLEIDLRIDLSDALGIMGATGAGKTTLLRVIAGLERDFFGRVEFCGDLWHDGNQFDRVPTHQRGLGVVFQDSRLLPGRTVESNLAFAMRRAPTRDTKLACETLTEALDLNHLLSEPAEMLSGGERQRAALARALLAKPRLLLLDEPLSNLDAKLRLEMRTEIRRIVDEASITTIYVTHDQEEALSLADRMAVLKDGHVVQVGAPRDLYDRPEDRFTASFLGDTNFLDGRVVETSGQDVFVETALGRLRSRGSRPENLTETVTVSIRPEAIQLRTDEAKSSAETLNLAPMTVSASMFLGQTAEVSLTAGDASLRALELHPRVVRSPGEALNVVFAAEDVVLLNA